MKAEGPKSFTLGFLLFALTEASWLLLVVIKGAGSRWVMEPTPALATTAILHLIAAAAFSWLARPGLRGVVGFAGGVLTGLVVALFAVGPGNIWPIVVFIDSVILLPTLAIGFFIGSFFSPRAHHAA